ncbi:MAG TPA: MerR family DNA-binding protein [Polyangiales bacterium]|nr:MerR family DNA-binding protein [Polyangiales bacterium]
MTDPTRCPSRSSSARLAADAVRSQREDWRSGEAASETGVIVKAIRHYEAVGLLGVLERDGSYRDFSTADLERLRVLAHCRDLGFGLPEIGQVLQFVADARPSCPDPEAMIDIVERRLRAINEQIARFQQLSERLEHTRAYLQRRLEVQKA